MKDRFCWPVTPVALEENCVCGKVWRFTVLTDRLIRLEYDPKGVFEDRASQSAFHRDFPKTEYTVERKDGKVVIQTCALKLEYTQDAPFAQDTLSIALKSAPATCWHYGDEFETLGGTVCTLDRTDGSVPVEPGVCSRNGFSVLDDSNRMILDDGWVDVREPDTLDLYFFGYGHDYLAAVKDYCRLTGIPPLLPAYALGNWWSRYHAYTQQEYLDLMEKFKREDVPFSVSVVDMDWHITKLPDGESGWTGYTWNTELFPDYKQFLKDLHTYNVKTALNLHPASGIRKYESMYEDMCDALGRPADGSPCSLDVLNPDYMEKYFDVVHHPYEQDGVDFWWMDWQQGKAYDWIHEPNKDGKLHDRREVLDPLWQLNHLHIMDIQRDGKRPMFFSRYSGPGSQRYPVGFSGDTAVTWESLDFQPWFTATASNIGYCWWSHDIGGHHFGYRDDDMTARWVQLGVFSPINRLHSTCNPFINKEPWDFDAVTEKVMRDSLKLRHRLFPYIYTMNYKTHTQLEPIVQPMYYSHPENQAAYEVKNQFWFGDQMIVAPITQKRSAASGLGCVKTWLPKGVWTDFFTGAVYDGLNGRMLDIYRDAYSIPVLCKAGAIVPLREHTPGDNSLCGAKAMEIMVFPGADNSFEMYEDAGDGNEYKNGEFAITRMQLKYSSSRAEFTVSPVEGKAELVPQSRKYAISFRGFENPESVAVNGKVCEHSYDSATHTVTVTLEAKACDGFNVVICGDNLQNQNQDYMDKIVDILKRSNTGMSFKENIYNYMMNDFKPEDKLFDVVNLIMIRSASPGERDVAAAVVAELMYSRHYCV